MATFSALLLLLLFFSPISALDFLFNSFSNITKGTDLILINDAQLDAAAIFLTDYTNMYTFGHVFHPTKIPMKPTSNSSSVASFSTSFVHGGDREHGTAAAQELGPNAGFVQKGNELMLVYDYKPNESLDGWIFGKPKTVMGWEKRQRVVVDVAEGLNYLHHGWDQMVVHRDIKSSNILLNVEMRGRLGDFWLAKLYRHGEVPNVTKCKTIL
ncbi:hypothetical protein ACFX13_009612 [Malus domestica]